MDKISENVLAYFSQISAIPRGSGSETRIREWLAAWGRERRFSITPDLAGNVLISVPASKGTENAPPLALQCHMDMVCEKTPESNHNFNVDPIRLVHDGEWLRADGTTLGADNGIGMALALAVASADTVRHPALELLFTVDEETGLTGAKRLGPELLRAKTLINIDSEDEGVFTVGCAGGRNTEISLDTATAAPPRGFETVTITVAGLAGGHSGVGINRVHGNANVILVRFLATIVQDLGVGIARMAGGSAHNAIPRDAVAVVFCDPIRTDTLIERGLLFSDEVRGELRGSEPGFQLTCERGVSAAVAAAVGESLTSVLRDEDVVRVLGLLRAVPHGVWRMSPDIAGLVQTSTNFATVSFNSGSAPGPARVAVLTSQRSSVMSELADIGGLVADIARLAGGKAAVSVEYPAWQPDLQSPLLARCSETYRGLFGDEAVIEVVHAGLECGVIGAARPGMDMISIGATIRGAHSPGKRVFVPSIAKVARLLSALIASYAA
ncbi:MAG TPA: aminoacyl-histidine dipeptidase [Spirochaetia bacterium]|nr:aminoacyl-histidine dipeptidase [Spirochaetia bacterium]